MDIDHDTETDWYSAAKEKRIQDSIDDEAECPHCWGCFMVPSKDPDGDVMNEPCPDCNPRPADRPTPLTNALANEIYARGIRVSEIRMLQHARDLERQLAEAIKQRDMARAAANSFRQCAEVTFGVMPFPRKFHWENTTD